MPQRTNYTTTYCIYYTYCTHCTYCTYCTYCLYCIYCTYCTYPTHQRARHTRGSKHAPLHVSTAQERGASQRRHTWLILASSRSMP
jgi:hypothetical protein